jgi:hypothetical protein
MKIKLTEMKNADVRFISLVKRGANRIPFRVIKSLKESEMSLDLSSIRRTIKADKPVPTVVGLVVNTADEAHLSFISEAVKAAGYDVEKIHKYEDGTTMFAQGDLPNEGEGTLVRLSDDLVVVVKNGDEQVEALVDNADLNEALQTEGFFFGPSIATKALQETMDAILKSDTADKAAAIKAASEKFQGYMSALTALIPSSALKLEEGIGGAAKKYETSKAEKAEAEKDAAAKAEAKAKESENAAEEAAETAEQEAAEDVNGNPSNVTAETQDPNAKEQKQKADDAMAQIMAALTGLTSAVELVTKSVTEIKESQTKLEEKVDETARKAEDATTAVKQTVVASAVKGDEPQGKKAVKSDEDPRSGYYDTAFLPKRK